MSDTAARTKNWKKVREGFYTFSLDGKEVGTMEIASNAMDSKANCRMEDKNFIIRRSGFWKSNMEIMELSGNIIARVYPEKWYASTWVLEYGSKLYKLKSRNNPLAEYVIMNDGAELLAYGLSTGNGKPGVRISGDSNESDPLFDYILWYLFLPVAAEHLGDELTFLLLLTGA